MIERRFGPLSEANRARIRMAGADELLAWGERLLTARSVQEIFGA
jgi:hypothetical protein